MNKLRLITVLFFGIVLFLGCQKWKEPESKVSEWIENPDIEYKYYKIGKNDEAPIYSILGRHTPGTPPDSILIPLTNKELRYVKAVVVSSDEGGNYYKSMVIQDETGGVELELDMTGLFNFYPVGQKIVLLLNGLLIGDYNYLPQIGWLYQGNQIGRINAKFISKYIFRDGLPGLHNLPKPLINDSIDYSGQRDVNKLVRLEGVKFEKDAIGKPFSFNDFTTEWKISVPLKGGTQEVVVRTSNFAKFRNTIIEDKEYNLTGILTTYRDKKQLMIRTKDDIVFTHPEGTFLFDFTTNQLEDGKWSTQSLLGNTSWTFRNSSLFHAGNQVFLSYKTAMDDWLISPVIKCPDYKKASLRFEHQLPVANNNFGAYKIYYTTSLSNPFNMEDWKLLGEITSPATTYEWISKIPLSVIGSESFRIAFRYYAPDKDVVTYDWNLRKVEIK